MSTWEKRAAISWDYLWDHHHERDEQAWQHRLSLLQAAVTGYQIEASNPRSPTIVGRCDSVLYLNQADGWNTYACDRPDLHRGTHTANDYEWDDATAAESRRALARAGGRPGT